MPKACSLVSREEEAISSTPQACGLVIHHPCGGADGVDAYRVGTMRWSL